MTALFLIFLIGWCWFLKVLIFDRPAPESPKTATFPCELPEGGTIDVHLHYQPNAMEPSLEPIVRCWALRLHDPILTAALYASLNAEIRTFNGIVKNLVIHPPAAPKVHPKQQTKADRELAKLMESKECAEVLVKATGAVPNRPIKLMAQERAQNVIDQLFKPIDHVQ
jgi:hypothetical protein